MFQTFCSWLVTGLCLYSLMLSKADLGGWNVLLLRSHLARIWLQLRNLAPRYIGELFEEPQIYRIDHYLGKELVQNLNRDNIANVQMCLEKILELRAVVDTLINMGMSTVLSASVVKLDLVNQL
ncbi:hypothetical protein BUALT_Bualt12G0096300 [Buddleja alternifolia]|uniref:glucose-6-phosphate dehydrogenase (NADP(+)) n=1 Tax=Buddleja alternifolia TaxID=168488 RepID=A0AAV6WR99_9LAMI|nr:hypothetical protein BUALT_Bualt12G0096300 [Buddleja alternifolia]